MGVLTVLKAIGHLLKDQTVCWYSDNQGVISVVEGGSMKPDLQDLAVEIYEFSIQNHISLRMEWLPRSQNIEADRISRNIDFDDWSIANKLFNYVDNKWERHDIDLFASSNNNKVPVFYSKFWTPGCKGVNAFAFTWKNANNWIVLPPFLILRTINKCLVEGIIGTLIVPYWTSSAFWPKLIDRYGNFKWFIKDYFVIENGCTVLISGTVRSIFGPDFKGSILCLRINTIK